MSVNFITAVEEGHISKYSTERALAIEYILRNKIDKPIKGEITKGKLRWRGIKDLCYTKNQEFLGVKQRDRVIGVDGVIVFNK